VQDVEKAKVDENNTFCLKIINGIEIGKEVQHNVKI